MSNFTILYKKGDKIKIDYITIPDIEDSVKRVKQIFKLSHPRQRILAIFKNWYMAYYLKEKKED